MNPCATAAASAAVGPVVIPAAVVGTAVALDDQPAVDEQVDEADVGDRGLQLDVASEAAQDEADKRLDPRLGARVEQVPQAAVRQRKRLEDLGETLLVEEAHVPGAVECRDRDPRRLTADRLHERLDEGGDGRVICAPGGTPVPHRGCVRLSDPGGMRIDLHMKPAVVDGEHRQPAEERHAVDAAAAAHGFDDLWVGAARQVGASPRPQQESAAHRGREVSWGRSATPKLRPRPQSRRHVLRQDGCRSGRTELERPGIHPRSLTPAAAGLTVPAGSCGQIASRSRVGRGRRGSQLRRDAAGRTRRAPTSRGGAESPELGTWGGGT